MLKTMFKTILIILVVVVLSINFVEPVRNFMNELFHRDKAESAEIKIIGKASGYNPRVKEMQQRLKEFGFDPISIDGIMGQQTRQAIKRFQIKQGLPSTGKIDYKTWIELNKEKEIEKANFVIKPEYNFISGRNITTSKLQEELSKPEEAKKTIEARDKTKPSVKSKNKTERIQIALAKAGFYKGPVDGKMGIKTKSAIRAFQKAKGLKADGIVGRRTWKELNKYLKE